MGIYVKKNACTYSLQFFSSLKNLIFRINIIFITFRVSILFFWYYCSICSTIVRVYLFFFCLLNHEYLITANNLTINFKSIEYTTYQSLYKTLHEKILYTLHFPCILYFFYVLSALSLLESHRDILYVHPAAIDSHDGLSKYESVGRHRARR